jgi:hypothetical protein
MAVASDGKIEVTATVLLIDYKGQGTVGADGATSVGVGAANGVVVTFAGTFAGGKGTGTWTSSDDDSGTWSVTK